MFAKGEEQVLKNLEKGYLTQKVKGKRTGELGGGLPLSLTQKVSQLFADEKDDFTSKTVSCSSRKGA